MTTQFVTCLICHSPFDRGSADKKERAPEICSECYKREFKAATEARFFDPIAPLDLDDVECTCACGHAWSVPQEEWDSWRCPGCEKDEHTLEVVQLLIRNLVDVNLNGLPRRTLDAIQGILDGRRRER